MWEGMNDNLSFYVISIGLNIRIDSGNLHKCLEERK